MTQDAIVTRELDDSMAEVVVLRGTACGSNCASCESCKFQNEIKTLCRNTIGAKRGQRVVIESSSSKIYGAILLVYVLPLITFLLGYFIADILGAGEGLCIISSFIALAIGAAIMVAVHRSRNGKNGITFEIIEFSKGTDKL